MSCGKSLNHNMGHLCPGMVSHLRLHVYDTIGNTILPVYPQHKESNGPMSTSCYYSARVYMALLLRQHSYIVNHRTAEIGKQ